MPGVYSLSEKSQHGVIFDSNHVLMAKSLFQAEGLAVSLYPQFKVAEGLDAFTEKYLKETYTPKKVVQKIARTLWSQKELLEDLPEHLLKIVQKMEEPEQPTQIDISQLKELEQEFEYLSKKRVIGIIISALIISSAVLFYLEGRTLFLGIPVSVIMFVTALLLLSYFIITHKKES